MSQRKNIGKVVIDIAAATADGTGRSESDRESSDADGTHLITGGLGAIGLRVADWLAQQGVSHLALLSRRAPTGEVTRQLDSLRQSGLRVALLQGDVTDMTSLRSALTRIPADFPPLRGVYHAAGVLADGMLLDMEADQLDAAMAPKVQGAWNLHELTRDIPLDRFVMFSSVASVLGSPGQANYAAGNAFLDGLAGYRRSRGLPATSINWGPWADGGMADDELRQRQLARSGMQALPPDGALRVMGHMLESKVTNMAVMDVRWGDLLARMPGEPPALLASIPAASDHEAPTGTSDDLDKAFCQRLREATAEQRQRQLCDYIGDEVAQVMGVDRTNLDADQSLSSFGLDSLMGMELKGKIESRLGLDLPMASLFDNPTIRSLARIAGEHFGEKRSVSADPSASQPVAGNGRPAGAAAWSPLVSLASGGGQPPLFCMHPIGGDLRCYLDVVRSLRSGQPVWGLRARGLEQQMQPHRSMEAMVGDYLRAIRQLEPAGPYHLVGWSTGGIYAYEIAHQLLATGANLGALILLDTPTPSIFRDVDLDDDARFLVDLVEFSNWFAGTRMQVNYQQLRADDKQQALQRILHEAKKNHVLPPDTPLAHLRRLIEVCKQNVHAIMQYVPPALSEPVHLVRPTDTAVLAEASGQALEEDLGWGSMLDGWTIHTVPGNHFSMMTGPRARHVAETIQACVVSRSDVLPVD
jgi:myxalamid-type polyketide synthase MxaB